MSAPRWARRKFGIKRHPMELEPLVGRPLRAYRGEPAPIIDIDVAAVGAAGRHVRAVSALPPALARAELERLRREEKALRAEVDRRGRELLDSCLDDQQRRDLRQYGAFEVTAQSGRRYLVLEGKAGNVLQEPDAGRRVCRRWCVHPEAWTPDGDAMLAQMLMLHTDEDGFMREANEHPSERPPTWWRQRLAS